jgi:hypothetical protein
MEDLHVTKQGIEDLRMKVQEINDMVLAMVPHNHTINTCLGVLRTFEALLAADLEARLPLEEQGDFAVHEVDAPDSPTPKPPTPKKEKPA